MAMQKTNTAGRGEWGGLSQVGSREDPGEECLRVPLGGTAGAEGAEECAGLSRTSSRHQFFWRRENKREDDA